MSKELEEAKLLSEKIDRLLAGEEVKPDTGMSSDMRQAFEFAREMKNMSNEPSAQFQVQLKEKLLRKLNTGTVVKGPEPVWWEKLVRQPVWQTVTAVLVIAIISGVIWGSGLFRGTEKPAVTSDRNATLAVPATTTTAAAPPQMASPAPSIKAAGAAPASESVAAILIKAEGTTNKTGYNNSVNDPVGITITLENVSGEAGQLAQYPPILSIMQADTMQPVYTFMAGQAVQLLAPDNSVSYYWEWEQSDANGNLVPPGRYYIELEDLDLQGRAVKLDFDAPVQFEIQ